MSVLNGGSVTISGGDVTWSGHFNSIGTTPGQGSLLITSGLLTVDYSGAASNAFNLAKYSQSSRSTLQLDIGGGISPIRTNGNVSLSGMLDVKFAAKPKAGQTFNIINYGGTLTGTFNTFSALFTACVGVGYLSHKCPIIAAEVR